MSNLFQVIEVPQFGAPEVMRLSTREFRPLADHEVLVRMVASGISQADVFMREGVYLGGPKPVFVPGYDVVGVVERVGASVARVRPGDTVAALTIIGSYAEYIYLDEKELHVVPEPLDAAEAVSLVLNYVTAYQMLLRSAKAQKGETVLVYGASGGVGTALLELGRMNGIRMVGTASAGKHELVRSYGAAEVIDHNLEERQFDIALRQAAPEGYDVILEASGGPQFRKSLRLLKRRGRLILYGVGHRLSDGGRRRLWTDLEMYANVFAVLGIGKLLGKQTGIYSIIKLKKAQPELFASDLQQLFKWVQEEAIKPIISARLPLAEARQAHELLAQRKVTGKIVLTGSAAGRG